MLIPLKKFQSILKDPFNYAELTINWNNEKIISISNGKVNFKLCKNIPILIDFKKSIFDEKKYDNLYIQNSFIGKRSMFRKKIKNLLTGSIYNSKKSLTIFKSHLPSNPKILIIGGGNIGTAMESIYEDHSIDIIATDVFPSNKIQFISDCHNLPIKDNSVDGVIVQAVLEHVLNPVKKVSEINRILKNEGIVFSEAPFMQQSHEEPYDFNRFTELGHRWLFKSFESIYRQTNGGPGLSLYWSIKSFIFSILNNKIISNILSLPFIILSYFDLLIPEKRKIKNANGFIFIGRKNNKIILENEITKHYIGQ
jgi:SAM-dependent methyltransferase